MILTNWINVFPLRKPCVSKISRNLRHQSMEYGVSDCFLPIHFFFFSLSVPLLIGPTTENPLYAGLPDRQIIAMDMRQTCQNQSQNIKSRSTATPTASPLPRTVPREEKRVWLPRINHANDSVKKIHWARRSPGKEIEGGEKRNH